MTKRQLLISGRLDLLRQIVEFCRHRLVYIHGPKEGERRLRSLRMKTAVAWWNARPRA